MALGNVLLGKDGGTTLFKDIEDFINGLPDIFKDVINSFLTAHIVITKIEIGTKATDNKIHYGLGLGLLFTKAISVGGISLEYFTFEYEGISGSESLMNSLKAAPQAY
jgi:hypothetical protein